MIIAHYGHRLIRIYNQRKGTSHDARSFFDEVFFPIVYDHKLFLQDAGNTPFGQADKQSNKNPLTLDRRREILARFHAKVSAVMPSGNDVMFGGSALDVTATTSFLLTDLDLPLRSDDAYASWIGAALAIGIQGGWCFLIDNDQVLYQTFEGWQVYRDFLAETPSFKPRQINTWNAHSIIHSLSESLAMYPDSIGLSSGENKAISTVPWPRVIFAIARRLSRPETAYVFQLSQLNKTIGFIQFDLPEVRSTSQWYSDMFANDSGLSLDEMERLYDTYYRFDEACQFGMIGLRALEPKGMRQFLPGPRSKMPDPHKQYPVPITIYKTWILAMLEDKNLYTHATEVAELFLHYEKGAKAKKTDRFQNVKKVLEQKSRQPFIEKLTELVEEDASLFPKLETLVQATLPGKMSSEQFRLFLTLVKFQYAGRSHAGN